MISLPNFPGLQDRVSKEPTFARAAVDTADRLGLDLMPLLGIMSFESGGTFDPAITNSIGATGLIQFMPATAKGLGTSTDELRKMSATEQLAYVEKYFRSFLPSIRRDTPGDYYMAVFMPAFVGFSPSFVLGEQDSTETLPHSSLTKGKVWEQNPGLRSGSVITVQSVWNVINSRIAQAKGKPLILAPDVPLVPPVGPPSPPVPVSVPPSPSLPPAWRSSGGPFDLPVLRVGARGTAVTLAQILLGCDVITGVYTEAMAIDYVRPLQSRLGMTPDAVIGRQTWAALSELVT